MDQPGKVANPARGSAEQGKIILKQTWACHRSSSINIKPLCLQCGRAGGRLCVRGRFTGGLTVDVQKEIE